MVDHDPRYPSHDPDIETYEERLTGHSIAPYAFEQSARTNHPEESVPLFLTDYDDEPDPSEYTPPLPRKRGSYFTSRILAVVLASAAMAILVALFSSDAARDVIASAKASTTAVLSAASEVVQSNSLLPKGHDIQLTRRTQSSTLEIQAPGLRSVATTDAAPTRENIKAAYQSALQSAPQEGGAPQAAAVQEQTVPADAIHPLDPGEIASLVKRADALIASGDLAAARLVLRRVAEAGDARAALVLAQTYDPTVLEKLGVHGVVPDLAKARSWYEKARQFGASEATSQLNLLASKQQ
jgi:TPR repeat protein